MRSASFPCSFVTRHAGRPFRSFDKSSERSQLQIVLIPRELKAEKYLGIVVSLSGYPDHQRRLLEQFISFLLNDDACISQLWSVGYSYFMLKPFSREKDLLSPLVIFQVRGSVAASGGHDPEEMLRTRMIEWGLEAETDFNTIGRCANGSASIAGQLHRRRIGRRGAG